jgi:YidC/Oxa1 family membrane protein insertase
MFWSDLVDLLRAAIMGVAQVCNGSVGVAVILVSLAIRLALLPLTLHLARRAKEHQRRLRELRPALERIQRRYANDPAGLFRETSAFYRNRNVKPFDGGGVLGGLAQAPVFIALYSALRRGLGDGRFLWIANTSTSNIILTTVVAALTGIMLAISPASDAPRTGQIISVAFMALMTVWFLTSTSALFALSTGAGSLVGILQALILRRDDARSGARKPSKT